MWGGRIFAFFQAIQVNGGLVFVGFGGGWFGYTILDDCEKCVLTNCKYVGFITVHGT